MRECFLLRCGIRELSGSYRQWKFSGGPKVSFLFVLKGNLFLMREKPPAQNFSLARDTSVDFKAEPSRCRRGTEVALGLLDACLSAAMPQRRYGPDSPYGIDRRIGGRRDSAHGVVLPGRC